jgi:hypothetical protein
MGFFTARERAALGKSAEIRGQDNVRELVRHDFAPPRRRVPSRNLADDIGLVMRQASDDSLTMIDDLIASLRRRRQALIDESERIQRDIVEYARLSQSTMQSTKIIAESLAQLTRVPAPAAVADAPPDEAAVLADEDDTGSLRATLGAIEAEPPLTDGADEASTVRADDGEATAVDPAREEEVG